MQVTTNWVPPFWDNYECKDDLTKIGLQLLSLVSSFEHLGCFTKLMRRASPKVVPLLTSEELKGRLLEYGFSEAFLGVIESQYDWDFRMFLPDLLGAKCQATESEETKISTVEALALFDALDHFLTLLFALEPCLAPPCWVHPNCRESHSKVALRDRAEARDLHRKHLMSIHGVAVVVSHPLRHSHQKQFPTVLRHTRASVA